MVTMRKTGNRPSKICWIEKELYGDNAKKREPTIENLLDL